MKKKISVNGFTFIEILITMTLLAVVFLPVIRMYGIIVDQVDYNDDIISASYVAETAMEKIKNFNLNIKELDKQGSYWSPPLDKDPWNFNGKLWRVKTEIIKGTSPLEVRVKAYKVDDINAGFDEKNYLVQYSTLIEDLKW